MLIGPPSEEPKRAACFESTASMTARTSSIRSSSVGIALTRSESPVPRRPQHLLIVQGADLSKIELHEEGQGLAGKMRSAGRRLCRNTRPEHTGGKIGETADAGATASIKSCSRTGSRLRMLFWKCLGTTACVVVGWG